MDLNFSFSSRATKTLSFVKCCRKSLEGTLQKTEGQINTKHSDKYVNIFREMSTNKVKISIMKNFSGNNSSLNIRFFRETFIPFILLFLTIAGMLTVATRPIFDDMLPEQHGNYWTTDFSSFNPISF